MLYWGILQKPPRDSPEEWCTFFHAASLTHCTETSPLRGEKVLAVSGRLCCSLLINSLELTLHWEAKSDMMLQTLKHLSAWGPLPGVWVRAEAVHYMHEATITPNSHWAEGTPWPSNPIPESPCTCGQAAFPACFKRECISIYSLGVEMHLLKVLYYL